MGVLSEMALTGTEVSQAEKLAAAAEQRDDQRQAAEAAEAQRKAE